MRTIHITAFVLCAVVALLLVQACSRKTPNGAASASPSRQWHPAWIAAIENELLGNAVPAELTLTDCPYVYEMRESEFEPGDYFLLYHPSWPAGDGYFQHKRGKPYLLLVTWQSNEADHYARMVAILRSHSTAHPTAVQEPRVGMQGSSLMLKGESAENEGWTVLVAERSISELRVEVRMYIVEGGLGDIHGTSFVTTPAAHR